MRHVAWLVLLICACAAPGAPTRSETSAAPSAAPTSSPTAGPSATPVPGCAPTQMKDPTGVITANGVFGVVGDTFALGDLRNGGTALVRRGAVFGDELDLQFQQLSTTAPAAWVAYGVRATFQPNPWSDVVFRIGWKPIGFEDSCWRVTTNGVDTGIVLGVGH